MTPKASINRIGEEDIEVDALGKGKGKGKGGTCWNCGGTGHLSAQCLTPKGNGKGVKGAWKGGVKGWGGKGPYEGKTGVRPVVGEEETNQEQEVNAFTKGKGKGKDWYRPYQGAGNDRPNGTGYQGVCWGCGEVGHQQRECPKTKIQNVDCDSLECDFFFGAVEVERSETPPVSAPPVSDFESTIRRIR